MTWRSRRSCVRGEKAEPLLCLVITNRLESILVITNRLQFSYHHQPASLYVVCHYESTSQAPKARLTSVFLLGHDFSRADKIFIHCHPEPTFSRRGICFSAPFPAPSPIETAWVPHPSLPLARMGIFASDRRMLTPHPTPPPFFASLFSILYPQSIVCIALMCQRKPLLFNTLQH